MNCLKKIYKKILYAHKSNSKSYIKYLRKKGISIGDNVSFYEPNTNYIDTQKGFLIKIGNNVEITRGVTIITHDYSWAIYKQLTGEIIGSRKKVEIGNNVFIGINSTIMPGVIIGNNVIIGANSVVTKDIPNNSVAVGNPAKVISNVENIYSKRKELTEKEAIAMFISYYEKYNCIPKEDLFDEFFWIFKERQARKLSKTFEEKLRLTGNYEKSIKEFLTSQPKYNGYNDFAANCMNIINKKEKQNEFIKKDI